MADIKIPKGLKGASQDVLWQMFRNGPTWDGDLSSKTGRSDLVDLVMPIVVTVGTG